MTTQMQRSGGWVLLLIAAAGGGLVRQTGRGQAVPKPVLHGTSFSRPERLRTAYAHLPLSFEENRGQFDRGVQFLARGRGYSLALSAGEAVVYLQQAARPPSPWPAGGEARRGRSVRNNTLRRNAPRAAPALLRMKLVAGNPQARVTGLQALPGKVNY